MKTHQSIFKSILMVALMLTIGVGQIWGTDVTIKFGANQGEGYVTTTSGNIDDNLAYSTFKGSGETTAPTVYDDGLRLYHKNNATTEGGVLRIYVRAGQSCTINSVVVTYSTGKLGYIASAHTYGEALSSVTKYNAAASPVTISDIDDTSIHLSNANSNTTQTKIQTVEISYSCEGDEDECTPGVASGIKAGDVVLIYYPTESKEFGGYSESGDSHWGDVHTYTTTPSGYYPFTVEAGSASGYWSFKNGSTYLAMSEGNVNKLVGSGTKNDASSWSVSINGSTKEATITNKANSTYLLKYNTNSPRFSSYLSSAGNTALPKIYKYCGDVKYYVTYYGNENTDGSVPTDATAYASGDKATVLGNTGALAKTGSTFAGWNTKADGTGTSYAAGDKITMSGSVSLYAKWNSRMDVASVGHVTITATPAGASAVAESSYANVDCGKTVTLNYSSVDPNYTFTNWVILKASDDSDVSGSVSLSSTTANNATFVMPAYAVKVSAVITAPWIYFTSCSSDLNVTYDANGGTGNVPVDANNPYVKDDVVTVLGNIGSPALTRDGYTFSGWNTAPDGSGTSKTAGQTYTITSNTTFYAVWTPNNYKITSISTNPASSGTVTATYNAATVVAGTTEIPCGSEVTLSQEANRDKTFTSWTIKNASTSADVTATYLDGNTLTMPPFNCTVTANYSAKSSCVVTFSLESGTISTTTIGGTDYTTAVTLYEGESITTLPTVGSISCGDWGSVVGWTTNSSYNESSTPPSYISAPYNPGSNTTVYAVYRKTDGSADFDGTNNGTYYVLSKTYYASSCFSGLSDETTTTTSQASATPFAFTKNGDYYNISCSEGYYIQYSSGVTDNPNSDAAKWTPVKANENGGSYTSGTEYWYFTNKGTTNRAFAFTTNSRNRFMESVSVGNITDESKVYYPMQLISASTYYYSIAPVCGTTYDITKGTCTPASSVLDEDDDYCDFSLSTTSVSSGGSVTVTLTPNKDYTYNASTVTISGGGSASIGNITETAGVITCNITGITADMTVNVTYVARPKYTVTLYDNGVQRTTLTEEHYNAGVTLPSGNNCTPGSAFTFEGWTESAVELNADPVRPAAATLHAAGSYSPTDDITLYSVYSRSVSGCDDFAAGVSGAYKLTDKASGNYALVTANANRYDKGSSGDAEIFYVAYAPAHSAYTIRTSLGYLGWSGGTGSETLTKTNTTPYYWNITAGTGGNAGYWNFQPVGVSGKQFSGNNTYFNLHSNSTKYYIQLTKIAMTYYYNTALCGDASITFHNGGGTISGTPTTPTGASWNSSTHVLSGLEDCDKITTFPTASYDGWTFVGWSTEDYTNCGKHTAGTSQYAEENASTEEPDASNIYKTDGNPYVVRGGSIDLYPIFTRFPDNEPFDIESGGRYYMYYLDPDVDDGFGAPARRYAGAWDGTKRYTATTSCAEATEFEFTKSGDVWHIQNTANDKWLGGKSSDDWLIENNTLGTLTDWTITIRSGNQFNATCQSGRQIIVYDNFFMDYSSNNLVNNPGYYCVYLGSCEERIFSSEPHPTPILELSGEPYVTSSASQRVRATATMTLTAVNLTSVPATRVKVTGTNLTFATSSTATPSTPLWVDLVSGAATATIYVYYTPTATEDGLENVIVTAQAFNVNSPKDLQTTGTVHCRHLPADFVIAAKWNNKWYALPSTCNSSGSSTTGVLITVDDDDAPTAATSAPNTTKWGLRNTKAGSRVDGSYKDRLVFTERGTTETANNQQALYNYNSADIYTNATYANYNNTNPERYEWIPVTSDFGDYELTNANDANRHLILRNSDGTFVAQNTDKAYDGKVRLLPATFYEEAPVQIVEWKENSVVVMYTGTETSATTKVGTNSASSAQTLSTHKLTHGIYELTTGQSLASNDGKNLLLTFGSMQKVFEIPVIITGNSTAATGHDKQDVIITKTGKLTAAATKYSYRNVYVYGGGKLKIASGTSLGVNNIIMRAGGITTSGIGSSPSATYEYIYPQVELGGTLTSTQTNIKYEYITDYDHWYQLCLPFDGTLSSITYPQEYYGDNVTADNHGSWEIDRYAGEIRATGSYDAWKNIELESATTVTAGHGYLYFGAPKKITIGGDKQRQKWGIQRITMPVTAAAATSAETADKNISVDSYTDVATSTKPNDQGWNLVGNPYMVNLTDFSSTSMLAGELVHTETVPWDGKWRNNGDGVRYVTIPDYHFNTYEAKTASVAAAAGDFMPGRAFFVQIAEGASTLTFDVDNRAALMPALYAKTEQSVDIETGIVMSNESKHDEVNFWIKDGKTAEYEYNADYPKTMNNTNFNIYGVHSHGELSWVAISPEIAEGSMAIGYQVPAAGEYTLSLSETYISDKIDALYVTDHAMSPEVTVDLMDDPYVFTVMQAETNDTRFTVSIRLKEESPGTATDTEQIDTKSQQPQKFIYHEKMYILRGGVIYDATGKRVREINK